MHGKRKRIRPLGVASLVLTLALVSPLAVERICAQTIITPDREKKQFTDAEIADGFFKVAFGAEFHLAGHVDRIRRLEALNYDSSFRRVASEATDKVKEYATVASDKAAEIGSEMTDLVKRYPVTSVLAVFGIGYIVGRFIRK